MNYKKLYDAVPSWNLRQDMNGLGGCTVKSFSELLESYKLDADDIVLGDEYDRPR